MGAHSTYSETPIGFWLQDVFGWNRNHYDRIVHFAFGALLTYPMREIALLATAPSIRARRATSPGFSSRRTGVGSGGGDRRDSAPR